MFKQLLSVFLQSHCAFCDRVAYSQSNRTTSNLLCEYCDQKLCSHQLNKSDRSRLQQTHSTFAWGRYDGQLKRAIALMKYQNKPEIGSLLGELLGQAWLDSEAIKSSAKVSIVPIPMHHNKQKQRGFNQAEIIAHSFCQLTRSRLNTQALIRTQATEAMFNLKNRIERAKNLQGTLQIGSKLPKYPVLLIDDIHTTGATVNEAIKVLQQHQIKVIGVAVVAKAGIRQILD